MVNFNDGVGLAFLKGALVCGIPFSAALIFGKLLLGGMYLPMSTENVLGFTHFFVVGGVINVAMYIVRERRIRFRITTLLLAMFVISWFATWHTLARKRYNTEALAIDEIGYVLGLSIDCSREGWSSYLYVTDAYISHESIDSDTAELLASQLERLPYLRRLQLDSVTISDADCNTLRAVVPKITIED